MDASRISVVRGRAIDGQLEVFSTIELVASLPDTGTRTVGIYAIQLETIIA